MIFSFENRTWSNVGLGFSATTMPYLHSLASQCSFFSDWTETNTSQNSLTQYIGETSGVNNPNTVNDCNPSTTCRSTDDNIFRQVRLAGGTARNYVEGATDRLLGERQRRQAHPCPLLLRHLHGRTGQPQRPRLLQHRGPALQRVRRQQPADLRVHHARPCATTATTATTPPSTRGRSTNIQRVLDSAAYKAGTVAVFIWYDEDHPVPNPTIAPTSHKGNITQTGIGSHAALLKTIEDMLGLPFMNQGQLPAATDLRSVLGI